MGRGLGKWGVGGLLWSVDLALVFVAALSEDDPRVVDVEDDCSEEWSDKCFEDVECGYFVVVR